MVFCFVVAGPYGASFVGHLPVSFLLLKPGCTEVCIGIQWATEVRRKPMNWDAKLRGLELVGIDAMDIVRWKRLLWDTFAKQGWLYYIPDICWTLFA